jgi:hypothetical protein
MVLRVNFAAQEPSSQNFVLQRQLHDRPPLHPVVEAGSGSGTFTPFMHAQRSITYR